jgi:hypothetical protein
MNKTSREAINEKLLRDLMRFDQKPQTPTEFLFTCGINKDWSHWTHKDQDKDRTLKDKDFKLDLEKSLRTRTKIIITAFHSLDDVAYRRLTTFINDTCLPINAFSARRLQVRSGRHRRCNSADNRWRRHIS